MLKRVSTKIYNLLLNIIAPPFCAYCKKFLTYNLVFCMRCKNNIVPIVSITRLITTKRRMKIFAVSDYKDPLKKLILAKRWGAIAASRQLGHILWEESYVKNVDFDYIVPIPLHWTRFARRGFNQAQEIAQVLAEKSGKPVALLLKREKRTIYQSQLVYAQRSENLKNAFVVVSKVEKNKYKNKHLLLVDDLMTTGATLHAGARELLKLKPSLITAAVVCRVI